MSALAGLFFVSFIAATLLPAQSEAVLAALHLTGEYDALTLLLVATAGNVLGSCVNWLLGRYLVRFKERRWFPVSPAALDRAAERYRRYGLWTLLFAWLPVVGDPLTFAAGMLRTPFWLFLSLVTIGKCARYAALLWAFRIS